MAAKRTAPTIPAEGPTKRPARGRPPRISTEALLDVARDVFLELGIRATTMEVARRAGVSEGVIFHRFKSKDALFREAMRFDLDDVPKRVAGLVDGLETTEIREALIRVASALLEIGRVAIPLMMMSWSNPDRGDACQAETKRADYLEMVKRLAGFFQARMDEGKLRRVDSEIFTRTFLGAIHHYCMSQLVAASEAQAITLPDDMFVRGLVDLLLVGAAPDDEQATSHSSFRRLVRG